MSYCFLNFTRYTPTPASPSTAGIMNTDIEDSPPMSSAVLSSGKSLPATDGATNEFTNVHSTISPVITLKESGGNDGGGGGISTPLILHSDEIRFQLNGTVSVTEYDPGCSGKGFVMLLIDVSGMLRAVKLAGFVALNMVKSKEPSPPIVSLVIFIVKSFGPGIIQPVASTGSPALGVAGHRSSASGTPSPSASGSTDKFTKIHSTVSPFIRLKFSVLPCGIPLIRQSDEIRFQLNGTFSITE